MKCASIAFLLLARFASSTAPKAAIPYFSNVRNVQVSQPDRQNYLVVDEEIWAHARPDLADLRLYGGDVQAQFALSEQYGGVSTEQQEAKILNLGSIAGHTEFDIEVGAIAEYEGVPPPRRERFRSHSVSGRIERARPRTHHRAGIFDALRLHPVKRSARTPC
jgi:hypothetical protein